MAGNYDAIIVGGGHNGLVTAAYLAKAGKKVLVLERREMLGGACVTEEIWPGFKVSTAAYVNSLFRPHIIKDLDLKKHGWEMLPRSPSSFTPFPDGRYLMMGPDKKLNEEQVGKFSKKDAAALPRYEAMLERVADVIEPTLDKAPPDPFSSNPMELWKLASLGLKFRGLGKDAGDAVDVLTGSAKELLDRWFESDEVKATLATDAIIGAFAAPSMPGTAYVLFHHVMGECNGVRGVWGYMRGGMGSIPNALAGAAKKHGAEIRTNAPVARILTQGGRAVGVALADGTEFRAPLVASNADCNVTFFKLMDPKELPEEYAAKLRTIDYSSASLKINVALAEVPNWTALPGGPGPQHRGTMHICPTMDYIERAYDDAKYGRPSKDPVLECTMASVVDPTVAPPGKHLMSMFIQYAPYKLAEGTWDEAKKNAFADRCFRIMDEYAPNFTKSVLHRQVLTPVDMEERYGLTGGNLFQGAMGLNRLFSLRPAVGHTGYKTPIRGLYLCGAAAHPGGGVMGACGYNAAKEMLKFRA